MNPATLCSMQDETLVKRITRKVNDISSDFYIPFGTHILGTTFLLIGKKNELNNFLHVLI